MADGSSAPYICFDFDVLPSLLDDCFNRIDLDTSHTCADTMREFELPEQKTTATGIIAGGNWEADPQHSFHGVYVAVNKFMKREG